MPSVELALTCPACGVKTEIRPELRHRNPVCAHCGQKVSSVEIFYPNGFIYVLSNPSIPGLFKIGYTERDVTKRVAELSAATRVPEPYIIEAFFSSEEPATDEAKIHSSLSNFRGTRKEFFRIDLQVALDTIYKVCGRKPQYCRSGLSYETPEEKTIREARERALLESNEARERAKQQAWEEKKRVEARERALLESEVYLRIPECKNLKTLHR